MKNKRKPEKTFACFFVERFTGAQILGSYKI